MSKPRQSRFETFVEFHGVILFIWALFVGLNWLRSGAAIMAGTLPGNDDNMRMAQIRDWLGGQNWNDLHQYRLSPSDPYLSHWSRISDVLFGLPVKALTPLVGSANAEIIAVTVIPALMLLLFFYLLVAITRHLYASRGLPLAVVFLASLSFFATSQFAFGRIDHHGLQLILALTCLLLILRSERYPACGAFAGIVAGIGLSVGIESALYVAAGCVAVTLAWVFNEFTARRRMRGFGIGLATTTFALLILSAPRTQWAVPYCDANSIVFVVLTLCVALTMVLLSAIGTKVHGALSRLCVAGVLGIGALIITALVFPHCLGGPYSQVDPRLADLWLSNVSEAGGLLTVFRADIFSGMSAIILPAFAAFAWAVYHNREGSGLSPAPRSTLVFVVFCVLGGLIQFRLIAFAMAVSVALCAFLILYVFRSTNAYSMPKKWGLRILATLLIAPLTLPLIASGLAPKRTSEVRPAQTLKQREACVGAQAMQGLQGLGAGFAITQIDLGAPILNHTNLSVSSAPYHRNDAGNLLGFDVFLSGPQTAYTYADKAKAQYIILCQDFPETDLLKQLAPTGLAAKLVQGEVPTWLSPIPQNGDSALLVYKVLR